MESYINDAPCLFFTATDDGTIVSVNDTLCKLLDFQREELTGQKLDLIFTLATRIFQQTHFFPLLKMQGHAAEIFITLQTKDKTQLPVLINAERKADLDKPLCVYVGILVHQRKQFEDELLAAKKAAEAALHENTALQAAKKALQEHAQLLDQQISLSAKQYEELRQFSRVITHDLQEPLRKLFVFTSMLQTAKDEGNNERVVKKIRSVSEQMRSIVSGLQQYVWLTETPVSPTKINLQQMLTDILRQVEMENTGVSIRFQTEDLPEIQGDAAQMQILFHELFSNAVRFRKTPGEVSIRVKADTLMQNRFHVLPEKYEYTTFTRVQLSDDGMGFDASYKEQTFALFRRLHEVSGRGVGLSLCKKIIENHQGSIAIDSQPGEGTTVQILLPEAQQNVTV